MKPEEIRELQNELINIIAQLQQLKNSGDPNLTALINSIKEMQDKRDYYLSLKFFAEFLKYAKITLAAVLLAAFHFTMVYIKYKSLLETDLLMRGGFGVSAASFLYTSYIAYRLDSEWPFRRLSIGIALVIAGIDIVSAIFANGNNQLIVTAVLGGSVYASLALLTGVFAFTRWQASNAAENNIAIAYKATAISALLPEHEAAVAALKTKYAEDFGHLDDSMTIGRFIVELEEIQEELKAKFGKLIEEGQQLKNSNLRIGGQAWADNMHSFHNKTKAFVEPPEESERVSIRQRPGRPIEYAL